MAEAGFRDPQARDVQHLLRQVEPERRLRPRRKQAQHPSRARPKVDHPPDPAPRRRRNDRFLDIGLGNMQRTELIPTRGVTREVGFGRRRTLGSDGRKTVTIAGKMGVMGVDDRKDSIEYGPAGGVRREPVENPSPVGKPFDQTARGQQPQVPRDARLTLVHDLAQFHHRQLLAGEQGDDAQTGRLPRRPQHIDRISQADRHKDIRISLC